MKFKYLISDMDGVLLDSEAMILDMYIKASDELGFKFPIDKFDETIGIDIAGTKAILEKYLPVDFDMLYETREKILVNFLANNVPPIKSGVIDGLEKIKALGIKTALATSTSKKRAIFRLHKTPILNYFNEHVYGDEVINGKPSPDIFLLAAKRLDVNPNDCVVFEDSAAGIMAAKSAGMHAVLIPDMKAPSEKTHDLADFVADDFLGAINYVLT